MFYQDDNITLYNDNCLNVLKTFQDNSIDSIISDPPYQLSGITKSDKRPNQPFARTQARKGFLNKEWDVLPSIEIWQECFRVLKPGAFSFFMTTPRQDSLCQILTDLLQVGFNMRFSSLYFAYAAGFPKAMNLSKAVDEKLGFEREVIGESKHPIGSEQAKIIDGCYTYSPKPALEIILVCQKPLKYKTNVDQAIDYANQKMEKGVSDVQCGGVWFNDCRMPTSEDLSVIRDGSKKLDTNKQGWGFKAVSRGNEGRFPANLICSDDILNNEQKNFFIHQKNPDSFSRFFDLDEWFCEKIKELPLEVQKVFPFLTVPKPSTSEKNIGCKDKNLHPTCKPIALFSYLVTLATRYNEIVLDPFLGSGTCGIASKMLGRKFIGIELEKDYIKIAKDRILFLKGR